MYIYTAGRMQSFFFVLNRVVRIVICASGGLIIQFEKGEQSVPLLHFSKLPFLTQRSWKRAPTVFHVTCAAEKQCLQWSVDSWIRNVGAKLH